jgi:uncharacterized membrane-anchored protein YitT (DUF2179 family)
MKNVLNKKSVYSFLFSTLGILILALSINLLSWQFKLVSSGLPGYALAVNYLSGFPVAYALLIANTIILLLNFILVGKTAGIKGIYGYITLSIFIELTKSVLNLKQFELNNFAIQTLLLCAQGLIAPIGISLAIVNKYSFGSYSSLIPIVDKFYKISPPVMFFVLDAILTIIITIFFGWEKGLLLLINAGVFFVSFKYSLKLSQKLFYPTTANQVS